MLKARFARERVEAYRWDMAYLIAKRYYGNVMPPSKFADEAMRGSRKEKTAEEIVSELIHKLRG